MNAWAPCPSPDKEEEKMRNIEYMIACARSARTSPICPFSGAPDSDKNTLRSLRRGSNYLQFFVYVFRHSIFDVRYSAS